MDRPHRPHPVGTTRSPHGMPTAFGGHRPTIEPDSRSETSCLLPLAGRVEGEQLLGIETERDSSKTKEGGGRDGNKPPPKKKKLGVSSWNNPRNSIFPVFLGLSRFGGSCSLGERGTMKVVGRVRREAIVYHRPTW